ncbi:hypothetical protein HFN20_09045 [Paenibacillus dendritiformis]|uniref:hypothetical protein n=1 Tax=Paenibacillus dendritiformis TaxID=130049 RepID=UPI00143DAB74|nr:hypothetical protein [Paenibacillus dendritiformis]NKI21367.1 hypothetical protein [Paenibacillus dendritiformis]
MNALTTYAKVEKPDGSYIRHEYDPEGLRSGICENGVTSRFVFDGWNMVNELDEDGTRRPPMCAAMNCWRKWTALEMPTTT